MFTCTTNVSNIYAIRLMANAKKKNVCVSRRNAPHLFIRIFNFFSLCQFVRSYFHWKFKTKTLHFIDDNNKCAHFTVRFEFRLKIFAFHSIEYIKCVVWMVDCRHWGRLKFINFQLNYLWGGEWATATEFCAKQRE